MLTFNSAFLFKSLTAILLDPMSALSVTIEMKHINFKQKNTKKHLLFAKNKIYYIIKQKEF